MEQNNNEKQFAKYCIKFDQGLDSLLSDNDSLDDGIKKIKDKITDLTNIKNLHFLLGAGASSDSIPAMKQLAQIVDREVNSDEIGDLAGNDDLDNKTVKKIYQTIKNACPKDLEKMLGLLFARTFYMEEVGKDDAEALFLVNLIQKTIYNYINIDMSSERAKISLELYKKFYQKLALRNKDLARVNIFTTNNDLFSETALGYLNINYNNGFSSGLSRTFNPARFSYTFSRKIDYSLEKYEPLENMVYLHKLHGSINWIEDDSNSFFNIKEIDIVPDYNPEDKNVLIYPTPLKQNKSLGSPYVDLIREFQNKLALPHSVLIIIGYSFSDEHINNAIYAALASNSSLNVVIFGNYKDEKLFKINDRRIYKISGEIDTIGSSDKEKIHYFNYIVNELLPDLDANKDTEILDNFIKSIKNWKK